MSILAADRNYKFAKLEHCHVYQGTVLVMVVQSSLMVECGVGGS